ncbi:hypothetical protein J2Z69_000552 [Paenibacillus shirakamiensis]|uniref:DUF4825 domain-containing protein n=1 Tax=Paenibacillus shirakamiensis TaxID=1265935 RepID=A0ABS4JCT7_9BACL|nr:hypothetical protein [Paenibacillus shirakamiensis]MBP1999533.1 hypothetical protein [Paenibacillus shirakamiensis]
MGKWRWIWLMICGTIIIAIMMAGFTNLGKKNHKNDAQMVFAQGEKPGLLSEDNLVDAMIMLPLSLPLSKADLNDHMLSVDLKITKNNTHMSRVYLNIAALIRFAFERTSNINQLLIRVMAEDEWVGEKHLLLAADIRRDEWPELALEELEALGDQELTPEIKGWFRFTETNLWKTRFVP